MKVLSVASEMVPLVKTGGLADVAGALPSALASHGVEMTTLVPGYRQVLRQVSGGKTVAEMADVLGVAVRLVSTVVDGREVLVLDAPDLFDRSGSSPYTDETGKDFDDNWLRFAVFSKVAAMIGGGILDDYVPDLVHAHDWQAGMVPAYLRYDGVRVPSVITVHNLAFQGQFAAGIFDELGLPDAAWGIDGVEYYGDVGFLKAGLQAASAITTVSPTYAREVRTADFGMGLDGLLNARADSLYGIINGIDTAAWNPSSDGLIARTYDARSLKARGINREALEDRFSLDHDDTPVLGIVTRLTWQKGMDVLAEAVDGIVAAGCRLAILGAGDKGIESDLSAASRRHAGRFGIAIGYDETASHLIQAGADAMVVPSRFEPCGLTQLIALRYGCVPVVARTGGLADTVIDANMAAVTAGVATGVQLDTLSANALVEAAHRIVELKRQPKVWEKIQKNGMKTDVSWEQSARRYADLYRSVIQARR